MGKRLRRKIMKSMEYKMLESENDDHEPFADFYSFNELMDEFE